MKTFPFSPTDPSNPQEPPVVVPDQVLPKDQEEFLHLHEKLGHVSFHLLQKMAAKGLIPFQVQEMQDSSLCKLSTWQATQETMESQVHRSKSHWWQRN